MENNDSKHLTVSQVLIYLIAFVISINVGKWIGIGVFKLTMWLGLLPYLERFFGWIIL